MRLFSPLKPSHQASRALLLALKDSQAGFTLIELLVTALLLVGVGAAVAQTFVGTAFVTADQRHHAQAAEIAQQDQETLRGLSVAQLNSLNQNPPRPVKIGDTTFTITSTAQFLNQTGGPSCQPGAAAFFKITSSVTWTYSNTTRGPVVAESVISPPPGGTIRAQVQDPAKTGLDQATVSASGPDVLSAQTYQGCAVLAGLPAGTYTVTYSKPGYVDQYGQSNPTSQADVTSTGNAVPLPDPIYLGLPGSVTATFQAGVNGNPVSGEAGDSDGLWWYGAGSFQDMSASGPKFSRSRGAFSASRATGPLYPFASLSGSTWTYNNNYQLWAGYCPQMQPPTGVNMYTVNPGATPTYAVLEPELDVFVFNPSSTRIVPAHVKLTYTSNDATCSDSWWPAIDPNAATSTHGSLLNAGQPYSGAGKYTVCADNGSRYKLVPSVTTSFTAATTVNIDLSSGTTNGTCP